MKIAVQANIRGFAGQTCSLLSMYDTEAGLLLVSQIEKFTPERRTPDILVVAMDAMVAYDTLFTPAEMGDAIQAFEAMGGKETQGSRIKYTEDAKRANPASAIETDGYDERGPKRRIAEGIQNEKVAVLATCWAIRQQNSTVAALGACDMLTAFLSGAALTI